MNYNDIPLFSAIKDRLGYLNERQRLIAENVANSDTPGYSPRDLKPFTISSSPASSTALPLSPIAPAITNPAHLAGIAPTSGGASSSAPKAYQPQTTPDSETRIDGNQVVLEEQMMKMNDARMNYNAAIGFYEQSMSLIQTAIRIPGK